MPTIANLVKLYLKRKPYIREALESGIANMSAIARLIQKETGIKNFPAIKAAVRRFAEEAKKTRKYRERKVLAVLKESSIKVVDNVSAYIVEKGTKSKRKVFFRMELEECDVIFLLGRDRNLKRKALTSHENCTAIIIKSPAAVEETPGVVAFLTTLLAENGINILEFISMWTETLLLIKREDTVEAYKLLASIIGE